jgi:hypothetical protein
LRSQKPAVDEIAIEKAHSAGFNAGANYAYKRGWDEHCDAVSNAIAGLPKNPPTLDDAKLTGVKIPLRESRQAIPQRSTITPSVKKAPAVKANDAAGELPPVQQRMLDALAEAEQLTDTHPTRALLAILCNYTHPQSTGFVKAMGALKVAGHIEYPGTGTVALTDSGREIANAPSAPGTPAEVQERVIKLIGGAAAKVLQPLIDAYPKEISREEAARAADYGHIQSTGFVKVLGRLRTLGFVENGRAGMIKAAPVLFLE